MKRRDFLKKIGSGLAAGVTACFLAPVIRRPETQKKILKLGSEHGFFHVGDYFNVVDYLPETDHKIYVVTGILPNGDISFKEVGG